ncbi:ribosomal protein S18-alanine N-acetyltransferase [Pseudoglutamicibacter albus]|uniref:ribosomal protein S18-alanine N-acetyltransferase n=1 Tax=Pseudoglutamicibacter albus TaxID=98671 RepID=UPI0006913E96|nr:ribosomal protein S18-alanine N-acetyltransferase [Pseudoglutamicibacter albus]
MNAALSAATETELAQAPESYIVRQLDAGDVAELMPLEAELFPLDRWDERMMREELSHPEWRQYWGVAEMGAGALIAYAGLQYSPHIADIQTIGVVPEHAGRGVAKYLMLLMESRARDWGATHMMLEVRASNERAIHLYHRNGFEEIARRRGYYPGGAPAATSVSGAPSASEDAVIMQKDIRGKL